MGAMKECRGIPANYKVIETLANSITPGITASATTGNPTMVSTTATADIMSSTTTTDSSADFTESTKAINSDNFLWMVNSFSKEQCMKMTMSQDLQQQESHL